METYYRLLPGISETARQDEIKIKASYRQQLAIYHPDKVSHLDEFLDLAVERTKELIEAYDYFKSKHGFR